MIRPLVARRLAILAALLAQTVSAQTQAPVAPAPAGGPAPYRSAMEGYQPYAENKLVPWKEANDTVGKVGGWRAYAKEAAASEPGAAAKPAPATPANPHAGHGKQ